MAIAMARIGGVGALYRNLSVEEQVQQVDTVKPAEVGMITNPVTVAWMPPWPTSRNWCARYWISWVPVTSPDGGAGGHRDQPGHPVRHRPQPPGDRTGNDPDAADHRAGRGVQDEGAGAVRLHKVEKLPLTDGTGPLRADHGQATPPRAQAPGRDQGQRRMAVVGAAAGGPGRQGPGPGAGRGGGADFLVVDTADGHSQAVLGHGRPAQGQPARHMLGEHRQRLVPRRLSTPGGRGQGRRRAGFHLYHPGGGRGGGAPGHRHLRGGAGGPRGRRPGDRGRRAAALRGTSPRPSRPGRTRSCWAACWPWRRGRPGRDGLHPRQAVQAVPRMGSLGAMRNPQRGRSYSKDRDFQDDALARGQAGAGGRGGPGAVPLPAGRGGLRAGGGPARGRWATAGARTIADLQQARFTQITAAGLAESHRGMMSI